MSFYSSAKLPISLNKCKFKLVVNYILVVIMLCHCQPAAPGHALLQSFIMGYGRWPLSLMAFDLWIIE